MGEEDLSLAQPFRAGINDHELKRIRPLTVLEIMQVNADSALMNWTRSSRRLILLPLPLILFIFSCGSEPNPKLPQTDLDPGSMREIAYTDKSDAFWVTSAGSYNNSPWHGLTASKRAYFEDLFIYADDTLLPRAEAIVSIDPVSLKREYPDSGIRESWTLLDGQATLLIQLEADKPTRWRIQPAILGGTQADDFEISSSEHEINIHLKRLDGIPSSHPYIKIRFSEAMSWVQPVSPGMPLYSSFLIPAAQYEALTHLAISVSLHDKPENLDGDPTRNERARSQREERISRRLDQTRVQSSSKNRDEAIAWAHASLDALIMDQTGKGIYAGLPWFDDYWGRDVFISFTGAVLVSGQFDEAKQILLSFANLQNIDPDDPNYGRVPNRAQPNDIIYNTTDGTPWFVRSIWDYYRYSGDEAFLEEMWPSIRHATRGALQNWTDNSGLLRHGDADTWMDARGPDGAWSPRGNRAIEIQFIWRDQLEITRRMAERFGDTDLMDRSQDALTELKKGLIKFRAPKSESFVDHLNGDDSQDKQIRPNVFLVPPLFEETCDWATFSLLAPQLVTINGVFSLSQDDPNFHPYHHVPGLYVQDAAYHNGIIWTWNSAASITQAIRFHQHHYAQALFDNLTEQILNRGAVGSIAELTDAWPREGRLKLSGTFTQAWSLAEYLRTFYQDILGIQPDLTRNKVKISPRLLKGMNQIKFSVPLGDDSWEINYRETASRFDIDIKRSNESAILLDLDILHGTGLGKLEIAWKSSDLHLRYEKNMGQWTVPAEYPYYKTSSEPIEIPMNSLKFSQLNTGKLLPVLKGPDHRLLKEDEVVFQGGTYKPLLEVIDPAGDDTGDNGKYVYPRNPQFETGLADILGFQVSKSKDDFNFTMEFSNLVDPGWHPEYGYQLTYTAIGISYDPATGNSKLGKNSETSFKSGFRADQIIYISGGILLTDELHSPLAEYLPNAATGAIGNAAAEFIQFRLPKELFRGDLETAQFQIAVGCQDDHGGAGMGDFRAVNVEVSEWAGGGKTKFMTSNVYDWLIQ